MASVFGLKETSAKRWLLLMMFAFLVTLASWSLIFFVGMIAGSAGKDSNRFPFRVADRFANQLEQHFFDATSLITPARGGGIKYQTITLPIVAHVVKLPEKTRRGVGGGLTEANEYILSISHDGEWHAATLSGDVHPLSIQSPENGFDDYVTLSQQSEFQDWVFNTWEFRYNDILYAEVGGVQSLLVSYTKFHPKNRCIVNRIDIVRLDEVFDPSKTTVAASEWTRLFETSPCLPLLKHMRAFYGAGAAGRMLFDQSTGLLYYTSGDYGIDGNKEIVNPFDPNEAPLAQVDNAFYGRVIAIDPNTGHATSVSKGQRNPQGIAIDRENRLWTVEHGPRGGDELNHVVQGRNYGWPYETLGTTYTGLPTKMSENFHSHDAYEKPALAWLPSIAPSTLAVIDGFHPNWDGDLLVGTLSTHKLVRIRISDERVLFSEDIPLGPGKRVRYIMQHSTGPIVLYTDNRELMILEPVEGGMAAEFIHRYISNELKASSRLKESVRVALNACQQCHSFEPGDHRAGPSLSGIFKQRVGSTSFDRYSDALAASKNVWTRERLLRYLENPEDVYPGTSMLSPGLQDADLREAIVDVLVGLDSYAE